MLALRSYAGFYTSIYGEWLRKGGRYRPFDQTLKKKFITEAGDWPGLVADTVSGLTASYPKGRDYPAFDPWSAEEHALLAARYAADLALIRGANPGALIGTAAEPLKFRDRR